MVLCLKWRNLGRVGVALVSAASAVARLMLLIVVFVVVVGGGGMVVVVVAVFISAPTGARSRPRGKRKIRN